MSPYYQLLCWQEASGQLKKNSTFQGSTVHGNFDYNLFLPW